MRKISRWLKHSLWAIDDRLADVIDALTPVAKKRYPPAPPAPEPPSTPFHFTGVSIQRDADIQQLGQGREQILETWRQILEKLANGDSFELR
jgi:hypothetical protein